MAENQSSRRVLLALVPLLLGAGMLWFSWPRTTPTTTPRIPVAKATLASSPAPIGTSPQAPRTAAAARPLAPLVTDGKPSTTGLRIKPSPEPLRAVADRYADLPILSQREDPPATQPRSRWQTVKLVREERFKYPLVRVIEYWQVDKGGQSVRIKQQAMVGDHLMLKLRPGASLDDLLARYPQLQGSLRKHLPTSGLYLVSFDTPDLDTIPRALEALRRSGDLVKTVEPDYIAHTLGVPNDTAFSNLWGLHNTGQNAGTVNVDIDAPEAWDMATGSRKIVVGCIDTGMDYTHPDLAANVWTNPHEIPGNGIDDDGNGYVDDVHGWDFYNNDNDPRDDHSHGTHTGGTLGAMGNNTTGSTGVCWQISIAALKFLGSNGSGSTSDALEAMYYATSIGAVLTSNSWGGGEFEQVFMDALDDAAAHDVLFVAAAGNEGNDNDATPAYPSSYTNPNVIAVAAINRVGALSTFSNYGATTVDVAAPGESIYSTLPNGSYGTYSGTSMATPHVAGLCALLKSYRPSLTMQEVKSIVLSTTKPLASLDGSCATGGLINARAALEAANDLIVSPGDPFVATGPIGGIVSPSTARYTITNRGSTSNAWSSSSSASWLTLSPSSGTLAPGQSIAFTASLDGTVNGFDVGTHTATFTITSASTRDITRAVQVETTQAYVADFTMDNDPQFTLEGQWQHGPALGDGGTEHGNPDPISGATGTNIIGINNFGDYNPIEAGPFFATSPAINLSGYEATKLRFQTWINIDSIQYCAIAVQTSTDGNSWTSQLGNVGGAIEMSGWAGFEVDLSAFADHASSFFVRFGYVTGEGVRPYSGWNVDDVQVLGTPTKRLSIALSSTHAHESDPGIVGTVTVTPAPATPLVVALTSSNIAQANLSSPTITIPANSTSATFNLTPVDDSLLDGPQTVAIQATASTYQTASTTITIADNESAELTLTLPESATEGNAPVTATLTATVAPDANVSIALASSDLTAISVPPSVTLLAGQTSVTFQATIVDDHIADGMQSATITASVPPWGNASASITVLDQPPPSLTVQLQSYYRENQGVSVNGGVVHLSAALPTDLTVTLASSDTAHLSVPTTIDIPAGIISVPFDLTLINDPSTTGILTVQITANASGFSDASANAIVYDLQSVASPVLPQPANSFTHASPDSDLTWRVFPGTGVTPTSYDVYFGTTASPGPSEFVGNTSSTTWALPRLSRNTTYFWQVIAKAGTESTQGPVWTFTVPPIGALDHFAWSGLPADVPAGVEFTGTISALDEFGDVITTHTGDVSITTESGGSPILLTELNYDATNAIEFTNVSHRSVNIAGWKIVLYDEMSWPSPVATFNVPAATTAAPGQVFTLTDGGVAPGTFPAWRLGSSIFWSEKGRMAVMLRDANGVVRDFVCIGGYADEITTPISPSPEAWTGFPFPIYNTVNRAYARTATGDTNTAADWALTTTSMGTLNGTLTVPFSNVGDALSVLPEHASIVNGQWSGALRIGQVHPGVRLVAKEHGVPQATSSRISVGAPAALSWTPFITRASEGAGPLLAAATISIPSPLSTDLLVTIRSSDEARLTATDATILAGNTSTTIDLATIDDALLNGSKAVRLHVFANGYDCPSPSFTVDDNETATLSVTVPIEAMETIGGSTVQGTISVSAAVTSDTTITLSSSLPLRAFVPSSVIVPAGETTAAFNIDIIDDELDNGTANVVITATTQNWTSGSDTLQVLDNEPVLDFFPYPIFVDAPHGKSLQESLYIVNYGVRPLVWSITGLPSWMTLNYSNSSIPGGYYQTVTATINTASLPEGFTFSGFTLTTNDSAFPSLFVPVYVNVLPSIPVLLTEPVFTGGSSNTISWSPLPGLGEYEVQCDTNASFTAPESSGWISATNYTFTNRVHNTLYHHRARSRVVGDATWTSDWSSVVTSTQDTLAPAITFALPDGLFTAQPSFDLSGSAVDVPSGVLFLALTTPASSTLSAETNNHFADWHVTLPVLDVGSNTFTIQAADNAAPPNITSVTWTANRIDPNAPPGSNRLAPMLASALAIDVDAPNANALAKPVVSDVLDAGDGMRYFTFTHRRRILPLGFHYMIDTSTDLTNWSDVSGDVISVGTTPTGDGVTELATWRITPAMTGGVKKFVRLRVEVD